ncbi:MAG: hypothetical protein RIR62_1242 [Pseudomonadota bacterium]|jgi:hypothetical protein
MARKPKADAEGSGASAPDAAESDVMAVVEATDPAQGTVLAESAVAEPPRDDAPRAEPPAAPPRRRSGAGAFFGTVLGGALMFAAGFGLARFQPDLLPVAATGPDLQAALAAQGDEIAALKAALANPPVAAPDPALADRLAALEERVQTTPADLEARLAALESRPAATGGADPAALEALRAEIAALKSGGAATVQANDLAAAAEARLAEVQAAAEALRAETEAATAATRRAAALTRVSAALESGAPFAAALADLDGDVPPVLAGAAEAGLPTLGSLQESFPAAARQALDAAIHADMGASWTERVGNFLRVQTGARSLEPREGGDPDAILSRAEAAVATGDLTAALTEIAALPEAAQAAMSDWTAAAATRLQAAEAIAALAAQG